MLQYNCCSSTLYRADAGGRTPGDVQWRNTPSSALRQPSSEGEPLLCAFGWMTAGGAFLAPSPTNGSRTGFIGAYCCAAFEPSRLVPSERGGIIMRTTMKNINTHSSVRKKTGLSGRATRPTTIHFNLFTSPLSMDETFSVILELQQQQRKICKPHAIIQ